MNPKGVEGVGQTAREWKPIIYGGTYYANVKTPERCPDCDGNMFISHGPKALVCYICWLYEENDKLAAQTLTLRAELQQANQKLVNLEGDWRDSKVIAARCKARADKSDAENTKLRSRLQERK